MQVEGLALAVGGKKALQDMLRARNPVLAAHGPYTAAGVSKRLRTWFGQWLLRCFRGLLASSLSTSCPGLCRCLRLPRLGGGRDFSGILQL